jgi:hypothetical protein
MIDILIVNYNLPEAVDKLRASIETNVPHRWIIVDNGSDVVAPHPDSTVFVQKNDGWMSGLAAGLDVVTSRYVWILTTSMDAVISEHDPLTDLKLIFALEHRAVAISPAWSGNLGPETHKRFAAGYGYYQNIGWANPAELWRIDFLRANLERRSKHGWGTDYELTYLAKQAGFSMWRANHVKIQISEHKGYGTNRRAQSIDDNQREANEIMNTVYTEKYGPDWRKVLGA